MEAYSSQVHGTRHTPVHNLSPADLVCESERGVYGHFHCPFNERNRFQSSSTEEELFFLRDFDRLSPYKSDQEHTFTDHSTGRADTGESPEVSCVRTATPVVPSWTVQFNCQLVRRLFI